MRSMIYTEPAAQLTCTKHALRYAYVICTSYLARTVIEHTQRIRGAIDVHVDSLLLLPRIPLEPQLLVCNDWLQRLVSLFAQVLSCQDPSCEESHRTPIAEFLALCQASVPFPLAAWVVRTGHDDAAVLCAGLHSDPLPLDGGWPRLSVRGLLHCGA